MLHIEINELWHHHSLTQPRPFDQIDRFIRASLSRTDRPANHPALPTHINVSRTGRYLNQESPHLISLARSTVVLLDSVLSNCSNSIDFGLLRLCPSYYPRIQKPCTLPSNPPFFAQTHINFIPLPTSQNSVSQSQYPSSQHKYNSTRLD